MQFEQKTITILDKNHKAHQVTAWLGVGTGLAYHHPLYQDGTHEDKYILVHLNTGACFPYGLTLPTEPEMQAFLEAVAALDPNRWDIDLCEFKKRYGRSSDFREKIKNAYHKASRASRSRCEACGALFEPSKGYYEQDEYAYCSDCCHW